MGEGDAGRRRVKGRREKRKGRGREREGRRGEARVGRTGNEHKIFRMFHLPQQLVHY